MTDTAPPPTNLDAEKALLGAILVNNQAIDQVSRFLRPDHFSEAVHGGIFEAILDLTSQGRAADPRILVGHLPKMLDDKMTMQAYLAHLAASATTVINAPDYAASILDLWVRRSLMLLGEDVASDARDPPRDLASAAAQLDAAELRVSKIREAGRVERSRGMAFHLDASIEAMAAAYKDDTPIGLEWCLPEIEAVVDTRMQTGDLVGLLGASGDLKTTTAVTQARFTAERGVPTLFLSGEQSVQQCIRQMHAQRLGVSAKHTNNGTVSPAEFEQVVEDAQAIRALPLSIETWSDMRVSQLAAMVRGFNRRRGRGLVIVDHAKKIVPDNRGDNLAQQVFQIFDAMKSLASASGNAILLLMQRNTDFLRRKIMRPVRADSYGGEGPIQNLDACVAIYRPSRWLREQAKIEEREDRRKDLIDKAYALNLRAGSTGQDGISMAQLYCLKSRYGDDQLPHQELQFEGRFTRLSRIRESAQDEMAELVGRAANG